MEPIKRWAIAEGCEHCLRVARITLAVFADFVICVIVLLMVKAMGTVIVGLYHHDYEALVTHTIDFHGKVGVLVLLAVLLLRDVWVQGVRETAPPCPH